MTTRILGQWIVCHISQSELSNSSVFSRKYESTNGIVLMNTRGGLFNRHACGHEQFAWDVRCEPAVIDVFAKIWGTDELLVSFGMSDYYPYSFSCSTRLGPFC